MWAPYINGFKAYLQLEKSLSDNTIAAYLRDIEKLNSYWSIQNITKPPSEVVLLDLQEFITWMAGFGLADTSQARLISGLKAFFQYCMVENIAPVNPTLLLEAPKLRRSLPDVLSFEEIENLIAQIDLSLPESTRNKAMLETLYSCGLRVSELVTLRISQLYMDAGFIRVIGKGDKERLIPIGDDAVKYIQLYLKNIRLPQPVKTGNEDIVFLNRRGGALSRVMVFLIIKDLTLRAGIKKTVSPHTFRHSFATHLVEGGADLRAVQEMLGHESITTTEIYTHLNKDFLRSTLQHHHPAFK